MWKTCIILWSCFLGILVLLAQGNARLWQEIGIGLGAVLLLLCLGLRTIARNAVQTFHDRFEQERYRYLQKRQ